MHAERRRSPRVPPDPGFVCTLTGAGFAAAGHNLATRLLDLSARGACLVTVGRLRERVPVIVDISVPQAPARFKARASVRWSVTLEQHGRTAHVAGLAFDGVLESWGERLSFLAGRRDAAPPPPPRWAEPQRRFKRFTPRNARVSCEPGGLGRTLGFRRDVALRLKDLSQGGAQVVCSVRLTPGRRVDLTLEVPGAAAPIAAEAQVRWCRRDTLSLEPRWDAGLVFKRMPPEDEERLKELDRLHLGC